MWDTPKIFGAGFNSVQCTGRPLMGISEEIKVEMIATDRMKIARTGVTIYIIIIC